MGIQGLLPVLKPIQNNVHLSKYKGERVGVDAYVWLHRGAFSCALELATGKPTKRYVQFCMKRVGLLKYHGCIPVIVFDGANLPMKANTEKERREGRKARKAKGLEYLAKGETSKAVECFQTCIDVTPMMAFEFIKALKLANVEFIVAPYEADSQLAYLDLIGSISCVLTEDSDLISFGCSRVLYKLQQDGSCIEILKSDLGNLKEMKSWTPDRFRQMCILSGCDYLASPPGIGVKTAMKLLERTDAYSLIKSWVNWGSAVKAPKLPPNYLESFRLADYTFQFQRVYDPKTQRLVTLTPIPSDVLVTPELMHSIGPDIERSIARGVAEGLLNPDTKQPYPLVDTTAQKAKENNRPRPVAAPGPPLKSSIFKQQQSKASLSHSFKQPSTSTTMTFKNSSPISVNSSFNGSNPKVSAAPVKPMQEAPIVIIIDDDDDDVENQKISKPKVVPVALSNPPAAKALQSIRSTHTKVVVGSSSKIIPARRKIDADSSKNTKHPQKKISSFFGMPRLSPFFQVQKMGGEVGQKANVGGDGVNRTETKSLAPNNAPLNFAGNAKDSRATGVLNLLKPPKARRVGMAPLKKK